MCRGDSKFRPLTANVAVSAWRSNTATSREAFVDVLRTGGATFHVFRNQLQQVLESGCAIAGEKGLLPIHLISTSLVEFAADAKEAAEVEKARTGCHSW